MSEDKIPIITCLFFSFIGNIVDKQNEILNKHCDSYVTAFYTKLEESLQRIFKKLGMDPVNNVEDRQRCEFKRKSFGPVGFYIDGLKVLEYEFTNTGVVIKEAQ